MLRLFQGYSTNEKSQLSSKKNRGWGRAWGTRLWGPVEKPPGLQTGISDYSFFSVRCVGAKSILLSLEKTGLKTRLPPLSWLIVKVSPVWTESPRDKIDKHSQCLKENTKLTFLPHTGLWALLHSSWVCTCLYSIYPVFWKETGTLLFLFHFAGDPVTGVMCALPEHMHLGIARSTRSICAAAAMYEETSKEWHISLQKDVVKVMSLKTDIPWGWLKEIHKGILL